MCADLLSSLCNTFGVFVCRPAVFSLEHFWCFTILKVIDFPRHKKCSRKNEILCVICCAVFRFLYISCYISEILFTFLTVFKVLFMQTCCCHPRSSIASCLDTESSEFCGVDPGLRKVHLCTRVGRFRFFSRILLQVVSVSLGIAYYNMGNSNTFKFLSEG